MGLIFSAHEKNADAWNLRLRLRLGSVKEDGKDTRDEPKELSIHGRAFLWAMDMP